MKWTSQNCLLKHKHQSIGEANYCNWLLASKQNGEIYDFKIWPSLLVSKTKSWKADFAVIDKHGTVVAIHEHKGFNPSDDNFRFKLALFLELNPEIPVFVNKRRVYASPSGHRVMNLPAKPKRKINSRSFQNIRRVAV